MKKIISVLLSVLTAVSCFAVIAFAQEEAVDYVVLGDSIAFGSGMVNTVEACYGKIVAETNGYNYVNHSIPGITSGVLLTMLTDGEKIRASVADAEIINISIGGNNFLTDNIMGLAFEYLTKRNTDGFDEIADAYYEDLCEIMNRINELNPDAAVLLQTVYNPQDGAAGKVYQLGGDKLNEMIRKYNAEHPDEIIIVEVAQALNGNADNFADDKIHPSAAGNELIAVAVLEVLYETGLGSSTEPVITVEGLDFLMPVSYAILINLVCTLFEYLGNLFHPLG